VSPHVGSRQTFQARSAHPDIGSARTRLSDRSHTRGRSGRPPRAIDFLDLFTALNPLPTDSPTNAPMRSAKGVRRKPRPPRVPPMSSAVPSNSAIRVISWALCSATSSWRWLQASYGFSLGALVRISRLSGRVRFQTRRTASPNCRWSLTCSPWHDCIQGIPTPRSAIVAAYPNAAEETRIIPLAAPGDKLLFAGMASEHSVMRRLACRFS
jgi:hypothetical protein